MSVDSTNSGQPSPQWREAYPEALREREQKLLRSRKRDNDEDAFETPQVGVGLSGGGLRSATFAFGILQALAKRRALREIDVLSTVSGGGYVGALISRLYSRDAVKGPDDVARAILPPYEGQNQDEEDQAGKEDSRISRGVVWKWLKANGRYLAPAKGSGDILLAGAVMIRNWLAVHFVLATFVLALFVGLHLVRELADTGFHNLVVSQSCALSDEANEPIAATAGGFPPFVALDEWLNCQLPFGGTYLWWSPWFVVPAFVLLCAVVLGAATWILGGDIFSKRRHRCSAILKRVLLLFGFTFGLAVVETLGQTIYLWWRDPAVSVDGWFLTGFVVVVIAAANVRNLAACFSDEHRHKWKGFPARLMLIVAAALLFTATFTAVNVLAHGIAWSFKYPSQVHRTLLESPLRKRDAGPEAARGKQNLCGSGVDVLYCPGSRVLQILDDCTDCITVGDRSCLKLSAWFGTLALLSALFGRCQAFLNHASLWPLYTARLIRAYAGASNPKRVNLSSGEDDHLGRVNVTRVDEDDDTSVDWPCEARAGLEKGAPLHLVNVTINETLDGGSGLQHNDLSGIGMAIGPAGISAGVRHHLVFAEPSWRTAYVFPEVPPEDSQAGKRNARAASRPYRMFEYGTKAEGA
ncbi:MAG: hypothetical protein OXN89_26080 [Bryobacterales bacterium]|nr:hypothetical protein [Bryobacterales bacterium]